MELPVTISAVQSALIQGGATLNPPATEAEITAAETRLEIHLPQALRALYGAFDGSLTVTPEEMWNFWPLVRLDFADGDELWGQHLIFCDALIWAPAYSLRIDPTRPEAAEIWGIVSESYRYRCCASAARFLERFPKEMGFHLFDDELA